MNHIQDFSENLSVLIIEDNFVLIEDYLLEKFKYRPLHGLYKFNQLHTKFYRADFCNIARLTLTR
jgi:hypothetical protein